MIFFGLKIKGCDEFLCCEYFSAQYGDGAYVLTEPVSGVLPWLVSSEEIANDVINIHRNPMTNENYNTPENQFIDQDIEVVKVELIEISKKL